MSAELEAARIFQATVRRLEELNASGAMTIGIGKMDLDRLDGTVVAFREQVDRLEVMWDEIHREIHRELADRQREFGRG